MCGYSVVLLIVAFFGLACAQVDQRLIEKLACIEHEQCGACLAAAAHCRWCADPYFGDGAGAVPRCNDDESLVAAGCAQNMIQTPEKPVWEVLENRELQDMLPDSETVVQIQPQRVRLTLRPKESRTVRFTYRPARNYPLDLYYLMDLTWSMKDDKETLVSLRDDLPPMLKNLTDNFRIGFGSFAEKPLMPFISVDSRRRANPCPGEDQVCQPAYSFRHHLSLTNEINKFIEQVNSSSVTANLDNAEAGLDALLQVVTCGAQVGWSPQSRKVVILLTDGLLHTAGDGKLGGVVKRNDGKCHLDENGFYSAAELYDYPSVGQIYKLLDFNKVNVIFAVTENVKDHYDRMHSVLEDFTFIAKLEADSSNILMLVKKGYQDIISTVNFGDDAGNGPVKLNYFSDCGVEGGPMIETTKCTEVEYGRLYNFEVRLRFDSCPEYKYGQRVNITILENQLGLDSLNLEVELQCGCPCESGEESALRASHCPANSELVCGVCQCVGGWSGPNCDCSIADDAASAALSAQCREPGVNRSLVCSGVGDCMCGACDCDAGYSSKYCQCRMCEISPETGMECGGAGRGSCACGVCLCADGWGGSACACTSSVDSCVAPADNKTCSGHGECICGECRCSSESGERYTGAFCEACASCTNPLCARAEPCVACSLADVTADCNATCSTPTTNYTLYSSIQEEDADVALADDSETRCVTRLEEGGLECEYGYTYRVSGAGAVDVVVRSRACAQLRSAMFMTSGLVIMGCVIFAGIIVIMVVKSAQVVSDRRAYAKFATETQLSMMAMSDRNQNPLYISPISEFRLPDSFPRDKRE